VAKEIKHMLKREDLVLLYNHIKFGDGKGKLDVEDPGDESAARLVAAGFVDGLYFLTDEGHNAIKQIDKKMQPLKAGIPFEERKPKRRIEGLEGPWVTGTLKSKPYLSDGCLFLLGNAKKIFAKKELGKAAVNVGTGDVRQAISRTILPVLTSKKVKRVLVNPALFVVPRFGGIEIVWAIAKEKRMSIALQAKYVDLIRLLYPSATFHAVKNDPEGPLTIRVTNKGFGGNIGAIMPVRPAPEVIRP